MKKVLLVLFVLLVPSIVNGSTFCVDSDSGNDIFISGITVNGSINEEFIEAGVENAYDLYINKDTCIKTENFYSVNESICVDNRTDKKVSNCPANYICKPSDIDIDKIEEMKRNLRDLGIKENDIEKIDWNGSAKCVLKDNILDSNGEIIIYPERGRSENFTCYDTDGNNSPTIPGELFFKKYESNEYKSIPDQCFDSEGNPSSEGPYIKEGVCYTEFINNSNRTATNGPGKEYERKLFNCSSLGPDWICKTSEGKGACVKDSKIGSIYDILERSKSSKSITKFAVKKNFLDLFSTDIDVFLKSYPNRDFYLYTYPEKLERGSKIVSWMNKDNYMILDEESTLFLLDYFEPGTMFAHAVRYCAMGLKEITCLDADWWPVVNGYSWTDWGNPIPTKTNLIIDFPIIGPIGKWIWEKGKRIWEKLFGIGEKPGEAYYIDENGNRISTKYIRQSSKPMKVPTHLKIRTEFEKQIEKDIISTSENDSVENIYALLINFVGTNQSNSKEAHIDTYKFYSSLKAVGLLDENIEYLESNETYFKSGVDGISTLDNISASIQKINNKMSCNDRVIIYIKGHGRSRAKFGFGGIVTLNKELFHPYILIEDFKLCPEPTIYFIISSCYSGQYFGLGANPKVRVYYSSTGENIVGYGTIYDDNDTVEHDDRVEISEIGKNYIIRGNYITGFSEDLERYAELYKNKQINIDDLMLLSHISALSKDQNPESPRALSKTDNKRAVIFDILLKESYMEEELAKMKNLEKYRKYQFIRPSVIVETETKIEEIFKMLDEIHSLISKGKPKEEILSHIDSTINKLSIFDDIDLFKPYKEGNLRILPEDREKMEEEQEKLKENIERMKEKIKSNLIQLKEIIDNQL